MCGIAGWAHLAPDENLLVQMVRAVAHRGPDGTATRVDTLAGLGHARLALVDLEGGSQPLSNEAGSVWLVCNGEIYNHVTHRDTLSRQGHSFATSSDCEVIVHLYEQLGVEGFSRLEGEFAFALWDANRRELILCRDRFGVHPLFYSQVSQGLCFASETKALLAVPHIDRALDLQTLGTVWTTWAPLPGSTMFRNVKEVLPAECVIFHEASGHISRATYWSPTFRATKVSQTDALDALETILRQAVRRRLDADVPIAAYLSGGLDSSTLARIATDFTDQLDTFSISFDADDYDESSFQRSVSSLLGGRHHTVRCTHVDMANALVESVYHTEAPQLRLGPVSMMLLAGEVRRRGYKAVITGEGADELFGGYDIFRETAVRRFMARDPHSALRRSLARRLYTYLSARESMEAGIELSLQRGLDAGPDFFSHDMRWSKTGYLHRYLSAEVRSHFTRDAMERQLRSLIPLEFTEWSWLERAQITEIWTFMIPYLLSSQGDRVSMAQSVELRLPFLDTAVVDLALNLPQRLKLRSLKPHHDKYLLRLLAARLGVPVAFRPKVPYRAPALAALKHAASGPVGVVLTPEAIGDTGLFEQPLVQALLDKARTARAMSEMEEMALCGIITTQLWHQLFVAGVEPGALAA